MPLGATWGNDPDVDSSNKKAPPLKETWINPAAPKYSTETLGWGGRLSGPNDGARNDIQVGKKQMENRQNSSCDETARWGCGMASGRSFNQVSFLSAVVCEVREPALPKTCPDGKPGDESICSPAPGSAEWSRWSDRLGKRTAGCRVRGVDCDMVFTLPTAAHVVESNRRQGCGHAVCVADAATRDRGASTVQRIQRSTFEGSATGRGYAGRAEDDALAVEIEFNERFRERWGRNSFRFFAHA